MDHARALVRIFQRHYNEEKSHSSLGYKMPHEISSEYDLDIANRSSWKTKNLGIGSLRGKLLNPRFGTSVPKLLETIRSRK